MGTESLSGKEERNSPEYLAQLLKDKKQIQAFPNVFLHAERLIDEEINKVRVSLFHLSTNNEPVNLPDGEGPSVTLSEKVFVPVKDYPDFNFVGRILGPRGMTAKQLEQDTGCKIMVRGKGSMRDKKKEEQNRGKPNWEHLSEDLHVLITVEDTENRAQLKLKRAMDEVQKLLVPAPEGEDELKKMQLMELAIINGTYRDGNPPKSAFALNPSTLSLYQRQWEAMNDQPGLRRAMSSLNQGSCGLTFQYSEPRLLTPAMTQHLHQLRSPTSPAGAPLIIAPRLPLTPSSQQSLMSGGPPPLMSPQDTDFVYPYPYPYGLATPTTAHLLTDYSAAQLAAEQSAVGAVPKVRRSTVGVREHPYQRVTL